MIQVVNYKSEKKKILDYFNKRNIFNFISDDYYKTVTKIINDVNQNGDKALIKYAKKFDKTKLINLKVSSKEITRSFNEIKKRENNRSYFL